MALTPEQQARLAELEKKFGGEQRQPNALEKAAPFTTGLVRGAVKKGAETTTVPLMRMLANAGLPWAQKEIEKVEAYNQIEKGPGEKLGGLAADVAMLSNPALKGAGVLARGVAAGAQGAAQHQAQNYGATGEVDLGDAALETGLTAATMGAGSKIGPLLKKLGIGATKLGVGVRVADQDVKNAINIEKALEKRKIPFWGGAKKIAAQRKDALRKSGAERADIMDKEGIMVDFRKVGPKTDKRILDLEASQKLDAGTLENALPAREQAIRNAQGAAITGPTRAPMAYEIPGNKAIDLRKLADDGAAFDRSVSKVPPPNARYNQELRGAYEDELLDLAKSTPSGPRYAELKREMAEDVPLLKAASREDKVARRLGLGVDILLGGASALNPAIASGILARRVLTSPGGGRALYEGGRAASSKTAKRGGKGMLDLARSGAFSPGEE